MEFNEKLQQLRRQKGLTQEDLAEQLFVSRTAISKWESGRGYPSIDSLKVIAAFYGVSIDELLSGEELLTIAEVDTQQMQTHLYDLVFGLLDCSIAMFFFLPFFGQSVNGMVEEVSLLFLTEIAPYLRTAYLIVVVGIIAVGVATLALQNCQDKIWTKSKRRLSLMLNCVGALLFIISSQPYGATLLFLFLVMKAFLLRNGQ